MGHSEALGRVAYEAYRAQRQGITENGLPLVTWSELSQLSKGNWIDSASAVEKAVLEDVALGDDRLAFAMEQAQDLLQARSGENLSTAIGRWMEAMALALHVIAQYELAIKHAERTHGLNLVEAGFCQGMYFEIAQAAILGKIRMVDESELFLAMNLLKTSSYT